MIPTEVIKVDPSNPEPQDIKRCASVLSSGGLVAFPTETVYGLGANLLNEEAIDRLYQVKKRPKNKPFTIHIAQKEKIDEFAKDVPTTAYKLIYKIWPGPLTVILKSRHGGFVGLRMPNNLVALNLIEEARVPVVVPSANLSGERPPKNTEDVLRSLNGLIDIVVDAGPTELGIESTIVDFTGSNYRIVRQGAIDKDEIDSIARIKNILFVCTGNSCRSVMAESLFRKMMKDRDDVEIYSAGTGTMEGLKASSETVELLNNEGIDVSSHLSKSLTDEMIKKADLILVMEERHQEKIVHRIPQAKKNVYLLKEFARIKDIDLNIIDPIGRSKEVYQEVFYIIKNSLERIRDLV
jgi:tRNA threonylcarbamoyl adenosine modification protein (Sua5/YciO/YrdC/YwlC family)